MQDAARGTFTEVAIEQLRDRSGSVSSDADEQKAERGGGGYRLRDN
jgi:hypothetical protein